MTEDVRKRISEKMSGRKLSEDTKKKMSTYAKSRGMIEITKKKFLEANEKRKIPVICVETGTRYESTSEAARQAGVCKTTISRNCKGKTKTQKWKYAENTI